MSHTAPRPLVMALALAAAVPQLQGCSGCQENKLNRTGDVADSGLMDDEASRFSADWGQWLSAATLADGSVGIAFYDREQGGIGFGVGTPGATGVDWAFENIDGFPQTNGLDAGDRGMYTSIAVAPNGQVWASFYDVGARNLRYGYRTNTPSGHVWVNGLADVGEGLQQDAGRFTSVAIDAAGKPVIAHYDKASGTLRVAHQNGTSFTGEVIDRGEDREPADTGEDLVEADVGMYARIRIANGKEYIAYYDAANGNLKLAIGTAGSYRIHVVDDDANVGAWPDMIIRGKKIHLAYQDVGQQHLRYAVGKPGSWTISKVDRGDLIGADTAMFIDRGQPSIVYFDGYDNDMKIARYDGENWTKQKIARNGAVGFHNEVVFAGGRYYAASYNYTKKNVLLKALD